MLALDVEAVCLVVSVERACWWTSYNFQSFNKDVSLHVNDAENYLHESGKFVTLGDSFITLTPDSLIDSLIVFKKDISVGIPRTLNASIMKWK